jgi:hypothetical protein
LRSWSSPSSPSPVVVARFPVVPCRRFVSPPGPPGRSRGHRRPGSYVPAGVGGAFPPLSPSSLWAPLFSFSPFSPLLVPSPPMLALTPSLSLALASSLSSSRLCSSVVGVGASAVPAVSLPSSSRWRVPGGASLVVGLVTPCRRCCGGVSCFEKWSGGVLGGVLRVYLADTPLPGPPDTSLGSLNPKRPPHISFGRGGGDGRASCVIVVVRT